MPSKLRVHIVRTWKRVRSPRKSPAVTGPECMPILKAAERPRWEAEMGVR